MKGAQVTVQTRAKTKREQAQGAPAPELETQDQLEDPLGQAQLKDLAKDVAMIPPEDHGGDGPSPGKPLGPMEALALGTAGSSSKLPHLARIQAAFGRYGLGGVRAYVGPQAQAASEALNAMAFASSESVVLGEQDLFTVAHEAAHIVQQRMGITGGEKWELHADRVAQIVTQGGNAEPLLDAVKGGGELDAQTLAWLAEREDPDAQLELQAMADQTQDLVTEGLQPDPHAEATDRLVAELTAALGLAPIPVLTGPQADAKLSGGAKGVMEGGKVFLHQGFDPNTTDGRELLAHEMVHAAQDQLQTPDAELAGLSAEQEAGSLASQFANTGSLSRPVYGLPTGHLAADNGAVQLQSALASYHGGLEGQKSGLGAPTSAGKSTSKMGGKENRKSKVSRYKDGVDGIADKIDSLSSFSEICDNIDDGPQAYGSALKSLEQHQHFIKLSEQWQGAKDGGADSGVMKRAFDAEFEDRGFWGSTERAYDLVARRAKARAKRNADAEAAAKTKAEAAGKEGAAGSENAKGGKGGKGTPIKVKKVGKVDPKLASLMNEKVSADLPALPQLKGFEGVSDGHLGGLVFERAHQQGLSMEAASGMGQSRTGLILDQLGDSFLGSFGKGATDQFLDSAVYDTVGKVGDKALTALSKGKFKVPFVGPAIGLIKSPPWEMKNWGVTEGLGKAGDAFGGIGKKMDAWGDASGTERFGLVLSAIADLMLGIGSIIEMAQSILGQLSTICYVAGGILIAVGLALLWLGVGAGLLTAGGWLVRAGGLLARINTVLGPVAFFFSTMGMVFRTAGAFFVPADMFAGELTAVGDAATDFGGKAGKKVGDKYGSQVSDKAMAKGSQAKAKAKAMGKQIKAEATSGQPAGQATGQKARTKVQSKNNQAQSKGSNAVSKGKANQAKAEKGPSMLQKGKNMLGATKKVVGQELGNAKAAGVQKVKETGTKVKNAAKSPVKTTAKAVAGTVKGTVKATKATVGTVKDHFVQGAKNTGSMVKSGGRAVGNGYKGFKTAVTQSPKKTIGDAWSSFKKVNREMAASGLKEVGLEGTYAKAKSKGNGIEVAAKTLAQVNELQKQVDALDKVLSDPKTTPADKARALWTQRKTKLQQGLLTAKKNLALVAEGANVLPQINKGDFDAVNARSQDEAKAVAKKTKIDDERKKVAQELEKAELDMRGQEQEHYRAQMSKKKMDDGDAGDEHAYKSRLADESDAASSNAKDQRSRDKKVTKLEKSLETARKQETLKSKKAQLKKETKQKIAPHKNKAMGYAERGQKVKFGDGDGGEGTLVRLSDGGKKAWVRTSQGEVQISTNQIRNPRKLKSALNNWKEAKKDLKPLKSETKSLKKELSGASSKTVAEVQAKLTKAKKKQTVATEKSNNSTKRLGQVQDQRAKDGTGESIDNASAKMQGLQKQIDNLKAKDQDLAGKERTSDQEIAAAKRQAAIDAGVTDHVSGGSSGNATGGMGSVYESIDTMTNLMGELFKIMPVHDSSNQLSDEDMAVANGPANPIPLQAKPAPAADAKKAEPQQASGKPATPSAGEQIGATLDGLMDKRPNEEVQAIAGVVAATEQAISLELTIDVDQTMEKRNKAIDALARFKGAHQAALIAYNAEVALAEVAKNTKAFADHGETLGKKSESLRAPMLDGKQKEAKRKSVLTGVKGDPGQPDSAMAGIVKDTVGKMGSNSGEFDGGKPKVDGQSGKQIEKAHKDGGGTAKDQAKQSTTASDEKTKFIDAGLEAQNQQKKGIDKNRQALYDKHTEEMEKLQQIKLTKAQALSERNQARDEFNSQAGDFLGDVGTFDAWAGKYRSLRTKVDGD